MNPTLSFQQATAFRARGVSLIFALLTLAALSLAAVALVRSVDTSATVIGNLGFKQDSTFHASQAAEEAIAWLDENKAGVVLYKSNPNKGYSAVAVENLDPTNRGTMTPRTVVDWNDDNCATPYASGSFDVCVKSAPMVAAATGGNSARYFISRLCTVENASPADPANSCARPIQETDPTEGEKGSKDYKSPPPETLTAAPYFRIVVRSVGARNAVSFTETIVHF